MAGIHSAAEGYEGRGRPDWRDHLVFAQDLIPKTEEAAHAELAYVAHALDALPLDASSFGMIHFDMEADNMRWQDGAPELCRYRTHIDVSGAP